MSSDKSFTQRLGETIGLTGSEQGTQSSDQRPGMLASAMGSVSDAASKSGSGVSDGVSSEPSAAKDKEEIKDWMGKGEKPLDSYASSEALDKNKDTGGGFATVSKRDAAAADIPIGGAEGRKNEFTLSNPDTRDQMKRMFDLTDSGEKGSETAYPERRA